MIALADFLNSGIRLTTPILFAALASLICARAGILNLAIEAKVLAGAFVGILVAAATDSTLLGILAAAATGAAIGVLLAVAHAVGVDLVVLAIGLNLLVLQLTVFLMRSFLGGVGTYAPDVPRIDPVTLPGVDQIPFLAHVLDRLNWMVYAAFAMVAVVAFFLRTRAGRHLLAVGEAPKAAASAGLRVGRHQLLALVAAGAIAGIGGAFLSVGDLGLFTRNMSGDRGWIGITAALLALNRPALLAPAAAVFGFASAASIRLQNLDVPPTVTQFIPQGAALIALILVGARARSRGQIVRLWRRSSWLGPRSGPDLPHDPPSSAAAPGPAKTGRS